MKYVMLIYQGAAIERYPDDPFAGMTEAVSGYFVAAETPAAWGDVL
jgi:hypothetical protein